MKNITALLVILPLFASTQDIGVYIDSLGRVSIGKDTVWEPFQVFAEAGPQLQLDQQSADMGNTSGLLITPSVEAGQSFTCGLTGELASVSLRMGTIIPAGNTMLELNIRDGSAPTGPILATSSFAISDDELLWYDIAVTPFIDVMAGDEFFIEVVHTGGANAEWDWVDGTDPYAGGTSWQHQSSWFEISSSDLVFRTFVVAVEKTDVLSVTSSGKVKVNDYFLPQFDGLNNQVMVTNGTGVLAWQDMSGSGSGSVLQDADGDTKIQVEESTDEDIIRFDMAGTEYMVLRTNASDQPRLELIDVLLNTFIGEHTGNANTTGYANSTTGFEALFSNTTGYKSAAMGYRALYHNTEGSGNTANGAESLFSNTEGFQNVANGFKALYSNTEGINNTAIGSLTLYANTTGNQNTATGMLALAANTTGINNTANGSYALYRSTTGINNTASGLLALYNNTLGNSNTANGVGANFGNTIGNDNTAIGMEALSSNVAGSRSTAIGSQAMYFASDSTASFVTFNVAVGYGALRGSNTPSANKGIGNSAIGYQTLFNNTTGSNNTATGLYALSSNTEGSLNTANGMNALLSNTYGLLNTAIGVDALRSNTLGSENTAIGTESLYDNISGSYNTAIGRESLFYNKAGVRATAIGYNALLYSNDTETTFVNHNVAVGYSALRGSSNPSANTGNFNIAIGYSTMFWNTSGSENTATGHQTLFSNTTGNFNTATGYEALASNEDGVRNTATGHSALGGNIDGENNTAVGIFALEFNESGSNNTALGYSANSNSNDFNNTTGIGYDADPTASNRIHLGNNSVSWIGGQVGWATYSDGRFKSHVTENVVGLDFIKKLRPVTYNMDLDAIQDWKALHYNARDSSDYREKYEIETYRFSGFIAQEVESASRNAGYKFSGVCPPKHEKDFYSLRYAEFVVPLVKAVQELSTENETLKAENNQLSALLTDLQHRVSVLELKTAN